MPKIVPCERILSLIWNTSKKRIASFNPLSLRLQILHVSKIQKCHFLLICLNLLNIGEKYPRSEFSIPSTNWPRSADFRSFSCLYFIGGLFSKNNLTIKWFNFWNRRFEHSFQRWKVEANYDCKGSQNLSFWTTYPIRSSFR